jgi:hypothetical protein
MTRRQRHSGPIEIAAYIFAAVSDTVPDVCIAFNTVICRSNDGLMLSHYYMAAYAV